MKNLLRRCATFVTLGVFLCYCQDPTEGERKTTSITQEDIASAQKLFGISFSNAELDTLQDYLIRNKEGYDSMRLNSIDPEIFPAILFDPRPKGFLINDNQIPFPWDSIASIDWAASSNELAFLTIPQLAFLIKTKRLSSVELTQFFIDRIKTYDPILKATITVTEDLALQQAAKADAALAQGEYLGILHGIPYGVKDLIAVKGYKTTWGAMPYKDQVIDHTASVISKLEAAGAVLVAKLTSGALARGDVWFGGKTVNPWDTLEGASGSSAGSASAVAAGLVPFALGTETLGSIVSPSNRCGTTGLRPTYGRVSRYGVMSLSWSMDKVGPITRSALDAAIVFEIVRGLDVMDRTTMDAAFNFSLEDPVGDLKIAYLKDDIEKDTSASGDNLRQALDLLKSHDIHPIPISLPKALPYNAFDIILRAESGAFFDELIQENGEDLLVQQHKGSRANSLRQSRFIPAVEYLKANRYRSILIESMYELFREFDVIIAPTFGGRQLLITNLTGHPALVVPTGFTEEGHPTSMTLLGNLFEEAPLLELGHFFQELTSFDEVHPPLFLNE